MLIQNLEVKSIMKNNIKLLSSMIVMVLAFSLLSYSVEEHSANAFSNQVIQKGATGEDVIELQSRLQYIGYYNGKIDGVFGWGTYWALRNFQYEFGLDIDGLAGEETKQKLIKATKYNKQFVKEQIHKGSKFSHYGGVDTKKQTDGGGAKQQAAPAKPQPQQPQQKQPQQEKKPQEQNNNQQQANNQGQGQANNQQAQQEMPSEPTAINTPNGYSQNDIQLMANAVYGEARGEPYEGQVAVAAVILNRIDNPAFPNTAAGVIFEPGAFTAVADGQIYLTPNEKAKKAVIDAINGWDPTGDAMYYFNPATATNKWIWSRPQIKRIGKHIFCD